MGTTYVFDTNSFRVFGNYYPEAFPSFWERVEELVGAGRITSCREVAKELELQNASEHLGLWCAEHDGLFGDPSADEMAAVARVFNVPHFQQLIGQRQQLKGLPVADPFLVARGVVRNACVVTEEALKPNAAKLPNVCEHFGVRCTNVQGFLSEVGWQF
ncbi:MAG: DUF4411 family protein [Coriobacteriia bacterium]|jgi:hypothetical protein